MTFPAWSLGARVERDGFRAEVIHADGDLAILQQADGVFVVARGDQRKFAFVNEADPHRPTLFGAMQELCAAQAEAATKSKKAAPKRG